MSKEDVALLTKHKKTTTGLFKNKYTLPPTQYAAIIIVTLSSVILYFAGAISLSLGVATTMVAMIYASALYIMAGRFEYAAPILILLSIWAML